ncbi:MAG TPA: glycosyl hydrolase, partial [Cytophagales bacterium]|nr:glycosyl hydrolase [Cytophagales bacterium]
ELLKELRATGNPIVVLINTGRPWALENVSQQADAILYAWWLGSEAGNAVADVLFGDYNPSAKLPITFPRSAGQIPIYYNHFNTGRPAVDDKNRFYNSSYLDISIYPQYEFGYGLSYTKFEYKNLSLSSKSMNENGSIEVSFTLTNVGKVDGEEIVQLYIRDKVGSVVRPIKELKDFYKAKLKAGESTQIKFTIAKEKLSFYDSEAKLIVEPGDFDLMIGASSRDIKLTDHFQLIKSDR